MGEAAGSRVSRGQGHTREQSLAQAAVSRVGRGQLHTRRRMRPEARAITPRWRTTARSPPPLRPVCGSGPHTRPNAHSPPADGRVCSSDPQTAAWGSPTTRHLPPHAETPPRPQGHRAPNATTTPKRHRNPETPPQPRNATAPPKRHRAPPRKRAGDARMADGAEDSSRSSTCRPRRSRSAGCPRRQAPGGRSGSDDQGWSASSRCSSTDAGAG